MAPNCKRRFRNLQSQVQGLTRNSRSLLSIILQVADEHSEDFTEKGYVNFKRIVWTDGFRKVLDSARLTAATGLHFDFFDGSSRWLHPIVMILSADYEEQ